MFIIQKEWFVKTARIGAALVITGVGLFLIAPNTQIQLLCATIVGMPLAVSTPVS
jgi:hypothetical protein